MPHRRLEDWSPLEPAEHKRQLAAVRRLFRNYAPMSGPVRVLDIGCGDGRIAAPLTADGHTVLGIDNDPAAVPACRAAGVDARLGDALSANTLSARRTWAGIKRRGPFDCALCLGHTFMLLNAPDAAVEFMERCGSVLAPRGAIFIDDLTPLWREVADGNWQEGISPDRATQLVWAGNDNVVALRHGADVNMRSWTVTAGDTPLRLWSLGELTLLARCAGLSPPKLHPGGLCVFTRGPWRRSRSRADRRRPGRS